MQPRDPNAQLLRLYYLQQLGISAWAPRVNLPGALVEEAQSVEQEMPEALQAVADLEVFKKPVVVIDDNPVSEKPAVARHVVIEEPAVAPPVLIEERAVARPVMIEESPPSLSRARSVEKDSTSAAEPAISPFQIVFAAMGSQIAVAVQIPATIKPMLREADAKLLGNILRWLDVASPAQLITLNFRWPLPGLPAAGIEQAGKGLRVFLDQAALEHKFTQLVIFGDDAAAALRAGNSSTQDQWQTWYTHGLAELLALPELKRDTWQTLLPLKMQLSS